MPPLTTLRVMSGSVDIAVRATAVADLDGEILIEHTRPAPGVCYVGNGRPRGPRAKTDQPSPKS